MFYLRKKMNGSYNEKRKSKFVWLLELTEWLTQYYFFIFFFCFY